VSSVTELISAKTTKPTVKIFTPIEDVAAAAARSSLRPWILPNPHTAVRIFVCFPGGRS